MDKITNDLNELVGYDRELKEAKNDISERREKKQRKKQHGELEKKEELKEMEVMTRIRDFPGLAKDVADIKSKMPKAEDGKLAKDGKKSAISRKNVPYIKSEEFIEDSDETTDDENPPQNNGANSVKGKSAASVSLGQDLLSASRRGKTQKLKTSKRLRSPSRSSESESSNSSRRANGFRNGSVEKDGSESSAGSANESSTKIRLKTPSKPSKPTKSISKQSPDIKASRSWEASNGRTVQRSEEIGSDEESAIGSSDEQKSQGSESLRENGELEKIQSLATNAPAVSNQTPFSPYKPPEGFDAATISFTPNSRIDDIFAPSNLEGKQIWHITAPGSVALSSLKKFSTESIIDGSSLLRYEDADYGLVPDTGDAKATPKTLLIPHLQDNMYKPAEAVITNTLHLQQFIKPRSHTTSAQNIADGASRPAHESRKTRNQQPEGLRMRYHAFGIPGSVLSDSSSEHEDSRIAKATQQPRFRLPDRSTGSAPSKKRKHAEINGDYPDIHNSPSKSKRRKDRSAHSESHEDISMDIDAPTAPTPYTIQKKHKVNVSEEAPTTITPSRKESEEARAKRRAEKHKAKLMQPFKVPRSASPVKPLINGNLQHDETDDIDGDDDVQGTAGATSKNHEAGITINGHPQEEDDDVIELPQPSASTMDQGETQEERRKRKEEKRKRKEEKRRRKEARVAGS
ncbi:MAG: hypothetical protein Q9164_004740 [Protoblastenia rupestris]